MKKIKLMGLVCVLVLAFTACGKKEEPVKEPTPSPTATEAPTPTPEVTREPQEVIDEIAEGVKEAYGENYLPSMPFSAEDLENLFNLKQEWYDAHIAEGPMISMHIDTFVGVHATEDHLQDVTDALNAYRDYQINEAFQYPMNMMKIQASKVEVVDDYVFFVTLGMVEDEEGFEEEDYLKAFEEENKKAIDAIHEVLSK